MRVTAYRPSGNAVVERPHATLNKLFATTVSKDQRDWDEHLPFVCFAYNTAIHSTTGFTPFYLMFMREANIGVDLVSDVNLNKFEGPIAEYVSLMRDRMREAYDSVCVGMRTSFEKAKRRYDERVKACHFEVGQKVWYFCPRRRVGISYKWSLATSGPYIITKKINDANFVIRLTPKHRAFVVNIDRLRAYADGVVSLPASSESDGVTAVTTRSVSDGDASIPVSRVSDGVVLVPEIDSDDRPLSVDKTRPHRKVRPPTRLIES